jgi:uncharacterized protein YbcC (UPF0753/DUF2309 family)
MSISVLDNAKNGNNGEAPLPEVMARLEKAIAHAAHVLPSQGPIGVFIHHNTLHAFQHLPFEEAVVAAAEKYGTEPFMSEMRYRQEIERGRIRLEDLDAVLASEADETIWPRTLRRRELRRALLWPGLREFSADNVEWLIEEEGILERLRDDLPAATSTGLRGDGQEDESQLAHNLFSACYRRLPKSIPAENPAPGRGSRASRPGEGIRLLTGVDVDAVIHPLLIRLCAVYLDQGQAYWPMPRREEGFYQTVRDLFSHQGQQSIYRFLPEERYLTGLGREFSSQAERKLTAGEAILEILAGFKVDVTECEEVIEAELRALPGWAGLFHQLELDPGLAPHAAWRCSLLDLLAVRLTMTRVAIGNIWRESGQEGSAEIEWAAAGSSPVKESARQTMRAGQAGHPGRSHHLAQVEHLVRVVRLYDAVQLLGLSAGQINSLSEQEFQRLTAEIELFNDFERRRILHLAYERRHELEVLAPLRTHRETIDPRRGGMAGPPKAQIFFCIDEREESMRRAIEEQEPEVETFGAAGFFGVAVNYRGLDDPQGVALCPVVVKPQHAVIERPIENDQGLDQKRQQRRRLWASLWQTSFIGSRTLFRGWIGTIGFGLLSLFPLLGRTLAPRRMAQLHRWLEDRFLPTPGTELTLMRTEEGEESGEPRLPEQLLAGFSIDEKAERVAAVLRPAGLTSDFSRLVVILGHGSTCLNNPHESAYHCGACGGRRGGPNARLFAAMANNPLVRGRLQEIGITIPDETWFLGGDHDTASDKITFFDEGDVPPSHLDDLRFVRRVLDAARAANALERSRRFESAWADKTPAAALRHVQERAEHLAEPRPECGHATNAVAIVGRRGLTRGLFLDRRAFLISYDPLTDADGRSLAALLGAAGPVCAGINLEYYFSYVDNERYGSGTKLPHNITGLLGVMNGQASDLRTGLPWQMVEIHEPVRLLLIVESTPAKMLAAAFQSPLVRELIENRWIRVATIDPENGAFHIYRPGVNGGEGGFEPFTARLDELPEVATSPDWFLGHLGHLPVARVTGPVSCPVS